MADGKCVSPEARDEVRQGGTVVISVPHAGAAARSVSLNLYQAIRSWFPTLPVLDKTDMVGEAGHRRLTAAGLLALFGEGFRIDRTTRTGLGVAAELFRLAILVGFRGILRDDVS